MAIFWIGQKGNGTVPNVTDTTLENDVQNRRVFGNILDEATDRPKITFLIEAIRTLILIVAPHLAEIGMELVRVPPGLAADHWVRNT